MAIDRPTFSESWYRVATLRPRLRSTVQTYRQHYRGEMWHVVRDPGNNQFFRLNPAASHFVGMLDGNRNVEQVWNVCNDQLGDQAPTQNEAIQLLGQLYASNLLAAELPADAAGMFDRYKKRVRREVTGYLQNLLFLRIPIFDPDRFLDRWVDLVGWVFTKWGLALWLSLLFVGFASLTGRWRELFDQGSSENMLDPANWLWLTIAFWGIKAIHELGHAFSCKKFGKDAQSGGEVHTIGLIFLIFMPVPYVDASSSWALRSKWQRIVIGAAGMYVELAVAAIAAIIWSQTNPDNLIHKLTYNMMFVASVSTILFNGNPLLRYDAYYMLSDLIEIPNLSQRSKEYLYYLVKQYAYGVRKPRNPAHTQGERVWLTVYGIASSLYRVVVCWAILLFVADTLFAVGIVLAIAAVIMWVFVPLGKWAHYLTSNPELLRTRSRAQLVTGITLAVLLLLIGAIPFPDHGRAEGIIWPRDVRLIHMGDNGFIQPVLASNQPVKANQEVLVSATNPELETELAQHEARRVELLALKSKAMEAQDAAAQGAYEQQLKTEDQQIDRLHKQLAALDVRSPIDGIWISPDIEFNRGAFVKRGEPLGLVATTDRLFIRAPSDQVIGPRMEESKERPVEVRVKNRPDIFFYGTIEKVGEAGKDQLPSPALGFGAGGSVPVDTQDDTGTKTPEKYFEVQIGSLADENGQAPPIFANQRVIIRFDFGDRPLLWQWLDDLRRLVQRRFHTTI